MSKTPTPEELDGIALRLAGEAHGAASTGRWDLFAESVTQAIREAVADERERILAEINELWDAAIEEDRDVKVKDLVERLEAPNER